MIPFLLLVLISLFAKAVKGEDPSEISFVNFSTNPVKLSWKNGDNEFQEMGTLQPYQIQHMDTTRGHEWAFETELNNRVSFRIRKRKAVITIPQTILADINVLCSTTKGDLHIVVHPTWAPLGAARFLELVTKQYYDGCALNRIVPNFLTQFGIGANYEQRTHYRQRSSTIPDDSFPVEKIPFKPGMMSYAGSGPNTRTSEVFIVMPGAPQHQLNAFGTNPWETPFAELLEEDLETVVSQWYSGYGDMPPWGKGPDPQKIYQQDGYDPYLKQNFPNMEYIETCQIIDGDFDTVAEEL